MTTFNSRFSLRQRALARLFTGAFLLSGVVACSTLGEMLEPEKIDYKSASKAKPKSKLDVPPDLTQLREDNRYAVPESSRGTATASGYTAQRAAAGAVSGAAVTGSASAVAPQKATGIRVERAGTQRWLVANQSAEVLWPRIKDFWQESGFLLAVELPESGVMETDWAENRAKIPQDIIRTTLGKVFDSLYSTGERDKFRTRLERNADGSTEIFISHRGATEVLTGPQNERTIWTARASDPELEAEFIGRLMARLGTEEKQAKAAVAAAKPAQERARLTKDAAGDFVAVDEAYDRSWRRVGLALDRVGFTVEDRDRTRGLYFVRYVDQASDAESKANQPGFFSRMFGSKDEKKGAKRYRIMVKAAGETTRVNVLDEQGAQASNTTANRILTLLNDQLK